ncbi:oligoribonuclease [Pseudomonas sp. V1]|uniref:oligoribonuclease n=1 Tax=Pseudomonas arcuscaelestis TaxID=2710591 RepID=UPI00193F9138|nr:oligoribonuclease [Pseudomonas arcuscaelestis]MBM3105526.1 oligoribonuclease [Pseudomonas arcuscaelestis]
MSINQDNLGWLDLETTGFTDLSQHLVYKHRILEIGVAVTDRAFNLIAKQTWVIHQDFAEIAPLCDEVVQRMHSANGLFEDVARADIDLATAEQQVIQFLSDHGVPTNKSPLCGNGVHFDRMFLEAQMPALNRHFRYRNMDISSVKEFLITLNPEYNPAKRVSHRALDDILESVDEARLYRALLSPLLAESA